MDVRKLFYGYVLRNILAMIGLSCYIIADTVFIAKAAGTDGMAALNLALPVYSLIFAIGSMLGTGAATNFSILRARGDASADRYFFNSCFFAVAAGLLFSLAGILFPEKILALLGGNGDIIAVGRDYIQTFMIFSPFFMLNYIFNAFVRNDGAPSLSMAATLTGSFSNILLDYIFMFPLDMGMKGAALATGLSPVIGIAVCSLHFFKGNSSIKVKPAAPSVKMTVRSCRLGISSFVGELSSGITTTVFNFLILGLAGNVGVAAYGVVANFSLVTVSVFNGIAQGSQPLLSRFYGSADKSSLNKTLKLGIITAFGAAVLIIVLVYMFTSQCIAIFNAEGSALMAEYAYNGMRLYFPGFIFAGFNIVAAGYFSATDQAAAAFVIAIMRGAAAIILFAFLLSGLFGMTGIWLAFGASELVTAASSAVIIRRGRA